MSIYKIIQELEGTRSKNEKLDILTREQDNKDLREFFRLGLDPFIRFYQKKDITPNAFSESLNLTLADAMRILVDEIATRKVTGNAAIARIEDILNSLDSDDQECIRRILKKDPDCGVDTTALKVWKGLYREYPVLLSEAFDQKYWDKYFANQKQFYVQLKGDGGRCNVVIRDGVVSVMSRAGNELNLHGRFDRLADSFNNVMIDGELVGYKESKFLSRKESNGLFTKAVKGTISKAEADIMHLMAWDVVSIEVFDGTKESEEYQYRFATLNAMFGDAAHRDLVSIIESEEVSSQEDAMAFYVRMRERGEEGAMLKTKTHKWADERSKEILKLKNIATCELRVVGAVEGEGVLKGNLGALILESECGKLSVNCSGFPLRLRSQIWANITNQTASYVVVKDGEEITVGVIPNEDTYLNVGSIVEVKYNELIDDKRTGKHSLFLPRFDKERLDKKHANTLEEIAKKGA